MRDTNVDVAPEQNDVLILAVRVCIDQLAMPVSRSDSPVCLLRRQHHRLYHHHNTTT